MFDQAGLWQFIQPYAHSTNEILFRLMVARGVATAAAETRGAITTNVTDYEFACLQVLIITEKLAASIAALHGLTDRERIFTGDIPGWPLHPGLILPMPAAVDGQSVRLRLGGKVDSDALLALRNGARQSLELESLRSPDEEIPIGEVRAAADRLYDWLRTHLLVFPQFHGVAVFEHVAYGIKCLLVSIDDIDFPGRPNGQAVQLGEEWIHDRGWDEDGAGCEDAEPQSVISSGGASKKRGKKRTRARLLATTHDTASEGLLRFIGVDPLTGDDK